MDTNVLSVCGVVLFLLLLAAQQWHSIAAAKRAAEDQKRQTEKLMRVLEEHGRALAEQSTALAQLTENSPMLITDEIYDTLHGAVFAILDDEGHPVCCGFFVTPCGVALTAAHSCVHARPIGSAKQRFRASTYRGQEFTLDLVTPKVGALDIAVLRIPASAEPPSDYLPLPSVHRTHRQLLGAPVALIHGSIAWNAGTDARQIASNNGSIITSTDSLIHCSVPSYKGHSGAALLFRSGQLIGLQSEGFNDLEQVHSETSPSTSADAVRLDVPQIWEAVQAASARAVASAAGGGGSGARRRK